jgi:hypothetical protein
LNGYEQDRKRRSEKNKINGEVTPMLPKFWDNKDGGLKLNINVPDCNLTVYTNSQQSINYFYENIVLSGVNGITWGHKENVKDEMAIYCYIESKGEIIELERMVKENGVNVGSCMQQLNGHYEKYIMKNALVYLSPRIDKGATQNIIWKEQDTLVLFSAQGKYDYKLLTRVLREIAYRKLEADGWVALHASGIRHNGVGLIIMGGAAVGKTTLALSMCVKRGWSFLSNDKLIIKQDSDGQLIATGFSSSTRLNYGTLRELGYEGEYESWKLTNDIPMETSDWKSFNGKNKLSILPNELKANLGIDVIPSMKIDKILFPQIELNARTVTVFHKESNTDTIRDNMRTPYDEIFPEDWLNLRERDNDWLSDNSVNLMRRLEQIESLNLEYSFDSYESVLNEIVQFAKNK